MRTQAGETIQGTLVDIDEDCLVILAGDEEILLEAEAIQMVRRIPGGGDDATRSGPAGADTRPVAAIAAADAPAPDPAPAAPAPATAPPVAEPPAAEPAAAVFPAAARDALAALEERVRGLALDIGEPKFEVYTDDLDEPQRTQLQREVRSIGDSYAYAVKTKDGAKVDQCVRRLRSIAERHEAADCLQTAGRITWHRGDRPKTLGLLTEAADALRDTAACFDLAMAQRLTGNGTYPATLRNSLREDSDPDDPALHALIAAVLVDGTGHDQLAGLLVQAAAWPPGATRKAVLHGGLLCVSLPELAGFPVGLWDAPHVPADAFALVAAQLHAQPAPALPARPAAPPAPPGQTAGPATPLLVAHASPAPPPAATAGPAPATVRPLPDDAQVKALADGVAKCLGRGDLAAAERGLADLKSLAPKHSRTWGAEKAVAQARSLPRRPQGSGGAGTLVYQAGPDRGPFARAETAMHLEDYTTAQREYRLAIESGDEPTRAVRRLATLLSTRLKRGEDALALLEREKHRFRTEAELWAWSIQHSTVLEHYGKWEEALAELRGMLERRPSGEERIRLIRRIELALLKTFRAEEARDLLKEELRRDPSQSGLQAELDRLADAIARGTVSKIEGLLQRQYTWTTDVSPLLTFHLDRCEYRGVRAERVARKNFTEDDIKRLDDLVSGRAKGRLGTSYPRERADYNLSAARIMRDWGRTDEDFRRWLRFFAAAMGDACALEAKGNADVIRTYYLEAVSVNTKWDDLADVKLRQLVMSFTKSDVSLLGGLPHLEDALALVMKQKDLTRMVMATLLMVPTTGETGKRLIRRIWAHRTTRELFRKALPQYLGTNVAVADEAGFTEAWLAAARKDRERREVYGQIRVLAEQVPALTALDRHTTELAHVAEQVDDLASTTDRERLRQCRAIVDDLRDYARQSVYVERERLQGKTNQTIRDLLHECESAPTGFSLQFLHPYLQSLEADLRADFDAYQKNAEPESLRVELVVDRFVPKSGKVDVQLQVSNQPDASPVSNVELTVRPSGDYTTSQATVAVSESIAAGESKTCRISLTASETAIEQELITLDVRISYTLRSQRRVNANVESKSIRLHTDTAWTEIPNPFSAGVPVENPDMFMGRDALIANLAEALTGPQRGSVIVYGQKRAGKSSVLFHLSERLTLPNVAVGISVQDLAGSVSYADFLYRIGSAVHGKFGDLAADHGWDAGALPVPDLDHIRGAPQLRFFEYMRELQAWQRNVPQLADSHVILLIDEFSMLHREIRVGNLPDSFMKGWKATLERGFFRCVLVGNDLMPRFIQEFPNEFQVAAEERVSYLDPTPATELIERPIRHPDKSSRYRGDAVKRILQLTGRSPYYIQLFCQQLVQYMNSEDVRGPAIGPADVEAVADKLVVTLGDNQFDNLLTPGDSEVTDISGDLVIAVLRATKRETGRAMYHELDPRAHPDAERVIRDLHRREVLEQMSGNRYRIRVGLFSQWLQHRWA